jgi:hypothetical protein
LIYGALKTMVSWQTDLARAARDAKMTFDSVGLVSNEAHARVMIALLRGFEQDPARVFCSPNRVRQTVD